MILLEDINSYPEMCAEHVLSRSTSTPPIPVSAFFTAFFTFSLFRFIALPRLVVGDAALDRSLGSHLSSCEALTAAEFLCQTIHDTLTQCD